MKRLILPACIGMILWATTWAGAAEIPDKPAAVGLRTGLSVLNCDGTRFSDLGVPLELHVGYNVHPRFRLLFSTAFFGMKGYVRGYDRHFGARSSNYEMKSFPLETSVLAFLPELVPPFPGFLRRWNVTPYASLGVGAARWWRDDFGDGEWSLIYDSRIGLELPISENICLDGGFRYDYYMTDRLDGFATGVAKDGTFGGFVGVVCFLGAERDTDKDGIPNRRDADPIHPEDFDGFEDEDGAPDPDNDGDGIPDLSDRCPNVSEDVDGFEDEDGCPDLDNDGDGIPDITDPCANAREDLDGFQDEDGCPDLDNDGDGILDSLDQCPNEPETFNKYRDEDGCPDEKPIEITKEKPLILKGVSFALGSAELTPESYAILDQVVESLVYYLEVKVEVQGHTDITGSRATNKKLSQKRATAVSDYLASKGVAPDRMKAVGYGPDRPIADNKTKEGRDQNRRVEIKRID